MLFRSQTISKVPITRVIIPRNGLAHYCVWSSYNVIGTYHGVDHQ
jgi:hypothetical protein